MNRSKICSDSKPSSVSAMRKRGDNDYPFPSDPIKEETPPEYRSDIRSIRERYRDYRKSVGDDQQYRFEEKEEE
jgi:hypothetical protein